MVPRSANRPAVAWRGRRSLERVKLHELNMGMVSKAVAIYLDLLNMFLAILSLLGGRRE